MQARWISLYQFVAFVLILAAGSMVGVLTGIALRYSRLAGLSVCGISSAIIASITYGFCAYAGYGRGRAGSLGWLEGLRPYLVRQAWLVALVIETVGALMGYALIALCGRG